MIKKISIGMITTVVEISAYAMDIDGYSSESVPRSPSSSYSSGYGFPKQPLIKRIQDSDTFKLSSLLDEASKIPGDATSKYLYAQAFSEKFKQSQLAGLIKLQFRIAQYLFQYGTGPKHDVSIKDYGCSTLIFFIQKGGLDFSFDRGIILPMGAYIQSLKENIEHELSILKSRGDRPDMAPLVSKRSYGSQLILSDLTTMPLLYLFEIARNKFTLNGEAPNSFDTRLRAARLLVDRANALAASTH